MNMVTVNIAVMDYCTGCIKMYSSLFSKHWQDEDVERWLCEHTDYKDSQCYFMSSESDIDIVYPDIEE